MTVKFLVFFSTTSLVSFLHCCLACAPALAPVLFISLSLLHIYNFLFDRFDCIEKFYWQLKFTSGTLVSYGVFSKTGALSLTSETRTIIGMFLLRRVARFVHDI